jgi:hypothetical protein
MYNHGGETVCVQRAAVVHQAGWRLAVGQPPGWWLQSHESLRLQIRIDAKPTCV